MLRPSGDQAGAEWNPGGRQARPVRPDRVDSDDTRAFDPPHEGDTAAVGRPGGRKVLVAIARQPANAAAVGAHHEELVVLIAAAERAGFKGAHEGDQGAVGRPARISVGNGVVGEAPYAFTSRQGHEQVVVEIVAQPREEDRSAVGEPRRGFVCGHARARLCDAAQPGAVPAYDEDVLYERRCTPADESDRSAVRRPDRPLVELER